MALTNSTEIEVESGELLVISASFDGGEECERLFLPLVRLFRKIVCGLRASSFLIKLARLEIWLYFGDMYLENDKTSVPARLATGRAPPRTIIDLSFSNCDYETKSHEELRQYFADGVEECFTILLERALKKNAVRDEKKLRAAFSEVVKLFRTEPIPPYVPLGNVQIL